MMNKVCHLSSAHYRYDNRILWKECISLSEAGYETTFIVNDNQEDEIVHDVHIHSTGYVPKNRIDRMRNGTKRIYEEAIKVDADLYHFHDPELLLVGKKLKKRGKRVIFDSHENYPLQIRTKEYIPAFLRKIIAFFYSKLESNVVHKIDCTILPCTFDGKNPFLDQCKNSILIGNQPKLSELHGMTNYSETPVMKICCVGSLTEIRGIRNIIIAAHRAGIKLILAGKFSPESFENEMKSMPEFSNVEYKGFINRDEVEKVYDESSIGISLGMNVGQYSSADALPTKVYEYMAAGIPVIVQKTDFINKQIKKYDFGIAVDSENLNEITNAIKFLIDNPDKVKSLGMNGKNTVLNHYNWEIEAKKLIELYENLLS